VRDSAGLGLGSVTVELSGSSSQTLSSDNNGRFSFGSCPNKGNFTVRAVSQDYQFVPSSYTITSLSSDVAACIFTATTTARGTNVHAGEARIVGSADGRGTINPDKGDAALIYFKGTGTGTYECRIFTLTGELVWQDTLNQVQEGVFKWIPKDVSSGGYVVLIKGPGINIKKKLAVLR
jgi:hypothetical protein